MKGLSLLNYPIVLAELYGPELRDLMFARLPSELRDKLLGGEIVASGWYPVEWKCALHEAGRGVTGDPMFARTMGYEMTKRDLRGIYALLIRATISPQLVLSLSSRVLGRYLRPVKLVVTETSPLSVRFAFRDGDGFSHELWQDVIGGCVASLETAGARHVTMRIEHGAQSGDTHAHCLARWLEPEPEDATARDAE